MHFCLGYFGYYTCAAIIRSQNPITAILKYGPFFELYCKPQAYKGRQVRK
uniref:Uncharacterized protein n=1 Tax=Anguilla anguilla TaxID=7936 RepID=A0A0E9VT22_ANGAN